MAHRGVRPAHGRPQGVIYIALLLTLAVTQALLALGAGVWSQAQRREREQQALWAGDRIRQAILDYHRVDAGDGLHQYPTGWADLLEDRRVRPLRRHLRQAYPDPLAPDGQWGLLQDVHGRWVGVYSRGAGRPIKQAGFEPDYRSFENAAGYRDWAFQAAPGVEAGAPAPSDQQAPPFSLSTSRR
jgi:hypothetical protein